MAVGDYLEIRNSLCDMTCPQHYLSQMKEKFREEIDSNRLFDGITTLKYLIRILEKRDNLNIDNINGFHIIASILKNTRINSLIEGYGKPRQHVPIQLPAASSEPVLMPISVQNSNLGQSLGHYNRLPTVIPPINQDPIARVNDLICSEIGKKWKDFARALGIREGYIDSLEEIYPRVQDRVQEVLNYHKQNSDSNLRLCNALDRARRKDLRIEVQDIFEASGIM